MCPNTVQHALVAADLVSARLCKNDTSCVRQPRQALGIVRDTLLDATISMHLEHARAAVANGEREEFDRHCEYANRLARGHAPDRVDEVERLLEASSAQYL
jgi:hypothetical protein